MKTINLKTDIPVNRELHITLPADVPAGPAELVVVISSSNNAGTSTLGELAESEFFGMWRDRSDISDSGTFACDLRSEGWKRSA